MSVTNPNFNPSGKPEIDAIKRAFKDAESVLLANTEPGRRQSIALTNLEQAAMWAVKAAAVGDDE